MFKILITTTVYSNAVTTSVADFSTEQLALDAIDVISSQKTTAIMNQTAIPLFVVGKR